MYACKLLVFYSRNNTLFSNGSSLSAVNKTFPQFDILRVTIDPTTFYARIFYDPTTFNWR